jgi:hypothetical protein
VLTTDTSQTDRHGHWMYATAVSVKGLGPDVQAIHDQIAFAEGLDPNFDAVYQQAEYTVMFSGLTHPVMNDAELLGKVPTLSWPDESSLRRYVTKGVRPSAEFLALPRGMYKWADAPSRPPIDYTAGRVISATEVTFTWHQVPWIPKAAYDNIGCVNDAPMTDGTDIYPSGTLLHLATDARRYRTATGFSVFDITYKLKSFQPQQGTWQYTDSTGVIRDSGFNYGHNFFLHYIPNPVGGGAPILRYDLITHNGSSGGQTVYPFASFKKLFQLG